MSGAERALPTSRHFRTTATALLGRFDHPSEGLDKDRLFITRTFSQTLQEIDVLKSRDFKPQAEEKGLTRDNEDRLELEAWHSQDDAFRSKLASHFDTFWEPIFHPSYELSDDAFWLFVATPGDVVEGITWRRRLPPSSERQSSELALRRSLHQAGIDHMVAVSNGGLGCNDVGINGLHRPSREAHLRSLPTPRESWPGIEVCAPIPTEQAKAFHDGLEPIVQHYDSYLDHKPTTSLMSDEVRRNSSKYNRRTREAIEDFVQKHVEPHLLPVVRGTSTSGSSEVALQEAKQPAA